MTEFSPKNADFLQELLKWRRDVRHFKPDAISEHVLDDLRSAMELAPSVGNARPWRVLRVETSGLRSDVRDIFARCNAEAQASYEDDKRDEYAALKLAGLEQAPVHLAVFTETAPEEGHRLGRMTMPDTLKQSTAMAVFSLMLAARSRNLGVGMVSILDPDAIKALFDVPDTWDFSSYLCIGQPEFMDDRPLLDQLGWQKNTPTTWQIR
jgi:5,6-dimethylbenzimidazole synthase